MARINVVVCRSCIDKEQVVQNTETEDRAVRGVLCAHSVRSGESRSGARGGCDLSIAHPCAPLSALHPSARKEERVVCRQTLWDKWPFHTSLDVPPHALGYHIRIGGAVVRVFWVVRVVAATLSKDTAQPSGPSRASEARNSDKVVHCVEAIVPWEDDRHKPKGPGTTPKQMVFILSLGSRFRMEVVIDEQE